MNDPHAKISTADGNLDIGYAATGYDVHRQPAIAGTAATSLAGLVHTGPPCWPNTWPVFALVLKTRVVAGDLIAGVTAYLEQEQEPLAMEPHIAAGLVAGIVVAAERMGRREDFDDLVDQLCVDMRLQGDRHPELLAPVREHDPATCDCPPVPGPVPADAQGGEGNGD